ncbi:MAG: cytochrome c peroxidase [Steroidobacteraceae bacterium]
MSFGLTLTKSCWVMLPVYLVALACQAGMPDEPIKPLPPIMIESPARVALGRQLFHDARLSNNNKVSCSSCHDLNKGGADGRDRAVGINGKLTSMNAPSVFNAALNFKQFWNGGADSLEAQIDTVVRNPTEMGSNWTEVLAKLQQDAGYRKDFAAAYGDGLNQANVRNAIASFERTLLTPDSRFDRYLRGDAAALSDAEKQGYAKFKQYGCVSCHQGVNVGGNMFQKFGIMFDYFGKRGHVTSADLGRYRITGLEEDRYVFKVPSLRNVALTAPYFHDASAKTLEDAVGVMFKYQLGRRATEEDKQAIVKFLGTLTGQWPGQSKAEARGQSLGQFTAQAQRRAQP